ncbi:hypothetical protein [Yersinia pseudotuberculosis]
MLKHEQIENTLIAVAKQQGLDLNGKDLLDIRTKVAATLAAKERHRQRMNTDTFQWKRPRPPLR